MAEKFQQSCYIWFLCPRMNVLGKNVHRKKNNCSSVQNFQQQNSDFQRNPSSEIVKNSTYISGGTLCRSVEVLSKPQFILPFQTFGEIFSVHWQFFLGRVIKTKFWASKKMFRGEIFHWNKYFFTSGQCTREFQQGFQNCFLCVQRFFGVNFRR